MWHSRYSIIYHCAISVRTRNLAVPYHRTVAMTQSFMVLGCSAWNLLPHDVKQLPTHWKFVSALRRMWSLICLICFIAFVSILYLINYFFFLFCWGLISGPGTSMLLARFYWGLRSFVLWDKWSRMVGFSERHLVELDSVKLVWFCERWLRIWLKIFPTIWKFFLLLNFFYNNYILYF
jgi:hypothetical protein